LDACPRKLKARKRSKDAQRGCADPSIIIRLSTRRVSLLSASAACSYRITSSRQQTDGSTPSVLNLGNPPERLIAVQNSTWYWRSPCLGTRVRPRKLLASAWARGGIKWHAFAVSRCSYFWSALARNLACRISFSRTRRPKIVRPKDNKSMKAPSGASQCHRRRLLVLQKPARTSQLSPRRRRRTLSANRLSQTRR
jgi:hypothetical protein